MSGAFIKVCCINNIAAGLLFYKEWLLLFIIGV